MTEEANILQFPKHKVVREVPEMFEGRTKKMSQKFADSVVDDIAGAIVGELDNYNIDIESETFSKDYALLNDVLKAVVYRQMGIDHHLHNYIDNNIKVFAVDPDKTKVSQERFQEKLDQMMKELASEGDQ